MMAIKMHKYQLLNMVFSTATSTTNLSGHTNYIGLISTIITTTIIQPQPVWVWGILNIAPNVHSEKWMHGHREKDCAKTRKKSKHTIAIIPKVVPIHGCDYDRAEVKGAFFQFL